MAEVTNTTKVQNTKPVATPTTANVDGEPKKSIFKKWWVWAIIILIILGISVGLFYI